MTGRQQTGSAQAFTGTEVAVDERTTSHRSSTAPQAHEPELTVLWESYWACRDRAQRNQLVLTYQYLVGLVASRLPSNVRAYWEIDDLRGFGCLGLVEAIDRFEQGSAVQRFPNYAMKRIRGAIFDELRRLDWLPRTVRRRVITYRATVDELSNELGRVPRTAEVLETMGISGDGGSDLLRDVQSSQLLHLQAGDDSEGGEETHLIDLIVSERDEEPEFRLVASEQLDELREAIESLPERQRTVITLRFLRSMTQEQIGAMLGVSNSRVCQIQATAIVALRKVLTSRDSQLAARIPDLV